jgi:hypothetical protein
MPTLLVEFTSDRAHACIRFPFATQVNVCATTMTYLRSIVAILGLSACALDHGSHGFECSAHNCSDLRSIALTGTCTFYPK